MIYDSNLKSKLNHKINLPVLHYWQNISAQPLSLASTYVIWLGGKCFQFMLRLCPPRLLPGTFDTLHAKWNELKTHLLFTQADGQQAEAQSHNIGYLWICVLAIDSIWKWYGLKLISGRPSIVSAPNNQTMFGQIFGQNSSGFLAAYRCIGFYRYFGQNRDILAKTGIFWPK